MSLGGVGQDVSANAVIAADGAGGGSEIIRGGKHQRIDLVGSVKRDVGDAVGFIALDTHVLDERERSIGEGSGGIEVHLRRRGTLGVVLLLEDHSAVAPEGLVAESGTVSARPGSRRESLAFIAKDAIGSADPLCTKFSIRRCSRRPGFDDVRVVRRLRTYEHS